MSGTDCYDLIVLGSGPAGQKAAIQGAKSASRVAIVDRHPSAGGACVHRGTIPSKTLRESALDVSRLRRGANVFRCEGQSGQGRHEFHTRASCTAPATSNIMGHLHLGIQM